MTILKYGEPVLAKKAPQVTRIDEDILKLVSDMKQTLSATPGGVGLAAPQVGISLQVSVIDLSILEDFSEKNRYTLINPRITKKKGSIKDVEGCLSFPGITTVIKRYETVEVSWLDEKGRSRCDTFHGFAARAFQHETDHLDGVLIIDRISTLKKNILKRDIQKLKDADQW